MARHKLFQWLFTLTLLASTCLGTTAHSQDAKSALSEQLQKFLSISPIETSRKQKMTALTMAAYEANNFQPLWGRFTQLEDVPAYLQIIKNHGLAPDDLQLLLPTERQAAGAGSTRFSLSEIYKTLWLAEICLLLREGTPEMNQKVRWATWTMSDLPGPATLTGPSFLSELSDSFAKAIISGVTLTSRLEKLFTPQNPIYKGLQKHYLNDSSSTPTEGLSKDLSTEFSKGPTLFIEKNIKAGDRFFRSKELAIYLYQQGFMSDDDLQQVSVIYNRALQQAMAKFQKSRNLLPADGTLNPKTATIIAEGSKPISKEKSEAATGQPPIYQSKLLLNLNRARQLPNDMGQRFVLINLATAELVAFQGKQKMHQTNVLIGSTDIGKQTPILRSQIESVVLNPSWLLSPNSAYEHLTKIRQNYWNLKNEGFEIVDHSGNVQEYNKDNLDHIQAGEMFLRQQAGNNNSLGSVLFRFPNFRYIDCYASNRTDQLKKDKRTVTNGRIGMPRNDQLITWLLNQNDESWNETTLNHEIQHGKQNNKIKLSKPIPIYIVYFTVIPEESEPTVIPDIYNLDQL